MVEKEKMKSLNNLGRNEMINKKTIENYIKEGYEFIVNLSNEKCKLYGKGDKRIYYYYTGKHKGKITDKLIQPFSN